MPVLRRTPVYRACRAPRWHLLATTWGWACSFLTPSYRGPPTILSESDNYKAIIYAATGILFFWSKGIYETQGQWKRILKIPENLKGSREPVSAGRKGTLCGGARIPHRLLLGSPPALESSRLHRGLSSHTLFPSKSTLPTPGPDCDIFRRKGNVVTNLPPPGKDKLEILEILLHFSLLHALCWMIIWPRDSMNIHIFAT